MLVEVGDAQVGGVLYSNVTKHLFLLVGYSRCYSTRDWDGTYSELMQSIKYFD
jgi:hypothetical protein